jgi:RNA polymerase sigma-70 factor (ECF subfamily)
MSSGGTGSTNADDAMSRYARGDEEAFSIVYDAVAPRLEGYLRRHLRGSAQVEDIIQQTFMQMHDKRGTFSAGAEVLPWAFSIARNFMIDTLRKTKRESSADMSDERAAMGALLVSRAASGEELLAARETGKRVMAAYEAMTEHQRAAYELTEGEGMSHAEAASVLGTTVMGVKQCRHKVHKRLRSALEEPDDEPAAGPRAATPPAAPAGET